MASPKSLRVFNDRHPLIELGFKTDKPHISSSVMADFYKCQRHSMFKHRLGLVPKWEESRARMVGTFVHECMRKLSLGVDEQATRLGVLGKVDEIVAKASQELGGVNQGLIEKVKEAANIAIAIACAFRRILISKGEGFFSPEKTEVLFVERAVKLALPRELLAPGQKGDSDIVLVGTLDAGIINKETGEYEICDYKTYDGSPADRAAVARIDPQVAIYRILAHESYGHPAAKFNHYVIKKPTIRVRQGETFEGYLDRLVKWYDEKAAEKPNDRPIVFSAIRFEGPHITREFRVMLREVHTAMKHRPLDVELWPKTGAPGACLDWYGRQCPYFDLCKSDEAVWVDRILAGFRQEFRYEEFKDG